MSLLFELHACVGVSFGNWGGLEGRVLEGGISNMVLS